MVGGGGVEVCNIGESRPLNAGIIPISNAASERAFSMVRKIETDFRSELAQYTTCTLLTTKMNNDIRPSSFVPNVQVLRAALEHHIEHSAAK